MGRVNVTERFHQNRCNTDRCYIQCLLPCIRFKDYYSYLSLLNGLILPQSGEELTPIDMKYPVSKMKWRMSALGRKRPLVV